MLDRLQALKKNADKTSGFAEKALAVFKAKGFNEEDINEARAMASEAWKDEGLKECWINWINAQHEVCR